MITKDVSKVVIEKRNSGIDVIPVNEIFRSIQGEGYNVGKPSILVRVNGCNLSCSFCDTKYTWKDIDKNKYYTPQELLKKVQEFTIKRVVFTGGEPLLYNLIPFIDLLIRDNFSIQIETNATIKFDAYQKYDSKEVFITASPKNLIKNILYEYDVPPQELKILIGETTKYEDVFTLIENVYVEDAISLQPIKVLNGDVFKRNIQKTFDFLSRLAEDCIDMDFEILRFSYQLQTFLNIR